MMALGLRSDAPEQMDDPALGETIYRRCLSDLAALNRLTGTHLAALRFISDAMKRAGTTAFSVLDVAFGQGDLLRALATLAARNHWRAQLRGIDLNPRSVAAAVAATPAAMPVDFLVADVFAYAPQTPPDFIVTSQFTHHLTDVEIVRLLHWLEKNAVRGWIITDLHRHFLPFVFFRFLAVAMRWHRIVRQDGTISIARGFRRKDWEILLRQAGLQAEIRWHFPFRYTVGRLK